MARLLSVNVGLPRDIAWMGRTVHTAIWKAPVTGRCRVTRLNLDEDGQGDLAGHGGEQRAVYVYQIESYRYWQEQLKRTDFVYGQFGENLTIEGLSDDAVCIGDRYRIGSALFEVTQPRVTCYRVGIRMNERRMAALLTSSGRPGFYLRVLQEGAVGAGDEIVKTGEAHQRMTVAEINALLYSPNHPRESLERALQIEALSPGWRSSFEALLHGQSSGAGSGNAGLVPAVAAHPVASGFRTLTVTALDRESADVVSLTMQSRDGQPLQPGLPGQYVVVRLQSRDGGHPLFRSYSLSGPESTERYRVSVKLEPNGAAGTYLQQHVRAGDALDVSAPRGSFILQSGDRPVVLVSAGIGATPVLAMLHALAAEKPGREVWWVQAARNGAERPFATEVSALLAGLPAAHSYVAFSRPGTEDRLGRDYDGAGRLSATVLGGLGLPGGVEAYLCGPSAFLVDVSAALVEIGVPAGQIHTEIFGARPGLTPGISAKPARAPHVPEGEPGTGPAVSFVRSDLTVPWPDSAASLLELAEACDVPVRWSCRVGVCHNCESGLLSGDVEYTTEPVDPPAEGNVLICSSRPRSAVVLDL